MTRTIRAAALGGALLLLAACGQGKPGNAVPDGDDAAAYVTAKFASTLQGLSDDFGGFEPRKSTLNRFARFDEKKADSTVSAVQIGEPPARIAKNHSNRDSTEYLDSFHPADSPVEYLLLGPVYASLAPTPWVSMPYRGANQDACVWSGYQDVCKMLNAVDESTGKGRAAKQAKSLPDGSIELSAEVSVDVFLKNRVIVFPDSILSQVTDAMRAEMIGTRILLDPQRKLRQIQMDGKVTKDGHELEVRLNYQILDPPTENDVPKVPDKSQVTALPDQAAVNDFYNRLGKIQAG